VPFCTVLDIKHGSFTGRIRQNNNFLDGTLLSMVREVHNHFQGAGCFVQSSPVDAVSGRGAFA
jgi:hypothetical protein